jgi:lipopolysaccharide/colanic/teichoic acid biosynthesis glycosyltransferase
MVKRGLDIVLSLLAIGLLLPVFLLCALAVRLDSPGPILFRQVRVGRHGRPFRIIKFRTMRHEPAVEGALVTSSNDGRITGAGHWLRRSKLDELPQLFNVLAGEMSLVGPRPEVPRYVALYPPELRDLVLSVRPGITDDAAIEFRDEGELLAASPDPERLYREEILPRKLARYAEYARFHTTLGDLAILWRTLVAVVAPRPPEGHSRDP